MRIAASGAAALLVLLVCGAASPPPPPADPSMAEPAPTTLTGYLPPDALDSKAILGPPPAIGSIQNRADRAAYDEARDLSASPRWKAAQRDNDLWTGGALKRYACALGRDIGETTTPVTQRMLHRVELDTRTVSNPAKLYYDRRRPMVGNAGPICLPREKWMDTNASYPSGHAVTGWAWGLILAELQPAKASAMVIAGREVGDSRAICGVHFVSDVEAGRNLGAAMVARLHADPQFQADLKAARRELERAPAPVGCEP